MSAEALRNFLPQFGGLRQFIVWQLAERADKSKPDKRPINPLTGFACDPHDPAIWMSAEEALTWVEQGIGTGIGFVITEGCGIACIDLDNQYNPTTQQWTQFARDVMGHFPEAAKEMSYSGTGSHTWLRIGAVPEHRTRIKSCPGLEAYSRLRFVALTGIGLTGDLRRVDYTAEFEKFIARYLPEPIGARAAEWTCGPYEGWLGIGITDEQILSSLRNQRKSASATFGSGITFAELYDGDEDALATAFPDATGKNAYDASAADQALANHLAYGTGYDCDRTARLMWQSALVRPKWDRDDYLHRTIIRAIAGRRQAAEVKAAANVLAKTAPPPPGGDDRQAFAPGLPMQNARLMLASQFAHPDHGLLVHQGGQSYVWDGTCWPPIEDSALRSRIYRWGEHRWYLASNEQKPFAPTQNKVAEILSALRAITFLPTSTPSPAWLADAPVPAKEVIACRNGLVHWPTRTMRSHTPTYYTHHAVPFAFDSLAPPPSRWIAFLHDLWGSDIESIETLQDIFGYLVSGDTSLQKMFLLIGPKRSGKGTIARVIRAVLGEHNVAGPTLASLGTNFGLQPLIGKPVAVIADARLSTKSDSSIVTERLLSISGEDSLTIDRKHIDQWTGQLGTRVVVLTNELPRFPDSSGALASRFIILNMKESFLGRENPTLTEELTAELPSIFNWALDGLARLRARGRFRQPQASQGQIRELEDLAAPIGAFLSDRCTVSPTAMVLCNLLYQAWTQWCIPMGVHPGSAATFGQQLRAAVATVDRVQLRSGEDRKWHYMGIGLNPPRVTSVTSDGT